MYNNFDVAVKRVEQILINSKGKSTDEIIAEINKASAFRNFPDRIFFYYKPALSTWQTVHNLINIAHGECKASSFARHLVGATLQLRFPNIYVSIESASTADMQTQRPGDFLIGHTAFHVTVAPMPAVYDKCVHNITQGYKPFLLVPDNQFIRARLIAEQTYPQHITVESIESFVSQNINEISNFNKNDLTESFKDLIKVYNQRVDEVETDKSLMIELPSNLL